MPEDKPSALEDVRKGLGLLFRAAKSTVERLPTKDLEEVVVSSAREVGRALENVGKTIEREVIRVRDDLKPHGPGTSDASKPADETKDGEPKPPTDGAA